MVKNPAPAPAGFAIKIRQNPADLEKANPIQPWLKWTKYYSIWLMARNDGITIYNLSPRIEHRTFGLILCTIFIGTIQETFEI